MFKIKNSLVILSNCKMKVYIFRLLQPNLSGLVLLSGYVN